jgi:quinol-cytochrome oxidoreductase complex cytochrome b subunit
MAFQIKGIDLNQYGGDSWLGLNRQQAKFLALTFIAFGLIFADPPFSLLPTDIVNIFAAGPISTWLHISFEWALLFTYTILAWSLILIGLWIYPHNTESMINGTFNKLKRGIIFAFKRPLLMLAGLVVFFFIAMWYKGQLSKFTVEGTTFLLMTPTELTTIFVVFIIIIMLILKSKQ